MGSNRLAICGRFPQSDFDAGKQRVPLVPSTFRTLVISPGFLVLASTLAAQLPRDLAMERSGYVLWLKEGPNSPLGAVAQQKIGEGLRLGPADADIPLAGTAEYRVYPSGAGVTLEGPEGKKTVIRGALHRIGKYALYVTGLRPGTVLTVF